MEKKQTEQEKNDLIYVEREIVHVSGKDYNNYFVRGNFTVAGKQVEKKVVMDIPKGDIGMYDVLDMAFEGRNKVELCRIVRKNRDSSTNRVTTLTRYEVYNIAGDLKGRLVPKGDSNTALLEKLFADLHSEEVIEETEDNND